MSILLRYGLLLEGGEEEVTTLVATTLPPTTLAPTTPIPSVGTVCWGHDTGVVEDNIRNFTSKWTGTASIQGTGDSERIQFDAGEYEESETWNIGTGRVRLTIDKYGTGSGSPTVEYKSGNSQVNCEADSWHAYTVPFVTGGWIKVRISEDLPS